MNDHEWLAPDDLALPYKQEMLNSASDDGFQSFRSNSYIIHFIENRSLPASLLHSIMPEKFPPETMATIKKFDAIGRGRDQTNGDVSPTMAFYTHQASLVSHLFGDMNGRHISEIGAGYGGQLAVLLTVYPSATATIFDIPEASPLQKRFLTESGIDTGRVKWGRLDEPATESDLVISCCALSEFNESLRNSYGRNVLALSHAGLILWNRPANKIPEWIDTNEDAIEWLRTYHQDSHSVKTHLPVDNGSTIAWGTDK